MINMRVYPENQSKSINQTNHSSRQLDKFKNNQAFNPKKINKQTTNPN